MSESAPPIRIGTRGSRLALIQAGEVRTRLMAAHPGLPNAPDIVAIKTTGDRVRDRALAEVGGKGMFTKEIEQALLDRRVELAVHSMKDMPTWLPDGLVVACLLPRADSRDALLANGPRSIGTLKHGAVVGTASLRRQAQLLHLRPDLEVIMFRGNVTSRIRKLADGVADATLLAFAGLERLDMGDVASAVLEPEEMLPAVAQGAIGIEVRADDTRMRELLSPLNDPATEITVGAERALLATLDGSCRTPIAALAELVSDDELRLRALIATPDGAALWRAERRGPPGESDAMGRDAGEELRRTADPRVFEGTR